MDETEAALQKLLNRLRANEDAKNGPGAFDQPCLLLTWKIE